MRRVVDLKDPLVAAHLGATVLACSRPLNRLNFEMVL